MNFPNHVKGREWGKKSRLGGQGREARLRFDMLSRFHKSIVFPRLSMNSEPSALRKW